MSKKNVRAELDKLSKDRLIAIIGELYDSDKKAAGIIQQAIDAKTDSEAGESTDLGSYRDKITKELAQKNSEASRLAGVKGVIRKAAAEIADKEQLMLLMLFAVEQGIGALRKRPDRDGEFSTGIADMFYHALELMGRKNLLGKYKKQCEGLTKDAKACGEEFSAEMMELYYEFYDAG